jgi:hypothetical protein
MNKKPINDEFREIGQDLFYGISRKKSYGKAFPYLLEAAIMGELHCQNLVAYCYCNGLGVEKDIAQAFSWYQRVTITKKHYTVSPFSMIKVNMSKQIQRKLFLSTKKRQGWDMSGLNVTWVCVISKVVE